MNIHILTITDQSDFDKQLHESAHRTAPGAYAYAEDVALPAARNVVDAEYHHALHYEIRTIEIIGEFY